MFAAFAQTVDTPFKPIGCLMGEWVGEGGRRVKPETHDTVQSQQRMAQLRLEQEHE